MNAQPSLFAVQARLKVRGWGERKWHDRGIRRTETLPALNDTVEFAGTIYRVLHLEEPKRSGVPTVFAVNDSRETEPPLKRS